MRGIRSAKRDFNSAIASDKELADRAAAAERPASETISKLMPYIWPDGRMDLKARVIVALAVLVLAKVVTVLVPYTYKWAVDGLTHPANIGKGVPAALLFAVAPAVLVIAYAVGRMTMMGFNQLRDAIFAAVSQHAVRTLANATFRHLHAMSLRFHLERRTGGLSRVIERGTKGIETIIRFAVLNTIPTLLEFAFMAVIFAVQFNWRYLAVLIATVVAYTWFTFAVSNWRIGIRRVMNESDTDANSKAVDSLLNYETVKYFNNEAMEAERFDRSMASYERATVKMWASLGWLNFGQAVIFSLGMMTVMLMSAISVSRGEQSVGDFVLVNALMMQLQIPLNFIGFVYREIRQGLIDIAAMFAMLAQDPEIADTPGAKPLEVREGTVRFENVTFHYEQDRQILKGIDFEVPAGKTVAIVGPSGAGKSTISRILFRFYDISGGRVTIDGQDIRDVTQMSLRRAIGMVPQDTVLFNDT
ncbi:MAG: ABC transporter ATP-binding protein/permease, partial [Rhodobiaceae bacterium]|nr:ABC transporter ATP-binding protein/permease [Rhodobiaceae bacterium]